MTRLVSLGGALAAVSSAFDGGPCLPLDVPSPQRAAPGPGGHAPDTQRARGTGPAQPPVEPGSPT